MSNNKKILIILASIVLFCFIRWNTLIPGIFFSKWYLSPFTYGILLLIAYLLYPGVRRNKTRKDKRKTILILTGVYLIVFLLMGLFVNFVRNSYWGNWLMMFTDALKIIALIFIQEAIRIRLVTNVPKKHRWIFLTLIVLTFFLWDINIRTVLNNYTSFEFMFPSVFIALLVQSFLTYLAMDAGIDSTLTHLLMLKLALHIVPIHPNIDWFFKGMYDLIMYVLFYFVVSYESLLFNRDVRKSVAKKSNPLIYIILLAILIFLVCFQLGFFVYSPTAIITNSMKPVFIRGDAVIIEKINEKTIHELEIDDIIEYKMGNRAVVHRIVDIDKSDEEGWIFTTKGDYNNGVDFDPVTESQVVGKAKFVVPWIGYPSVYFIEYFSKNDPAPVETGD